MKLNKIFGLTVLFLGFAVLTFILTPPIRKAFAGTFSRGGSSYITIAGSGNSLIAGIANATTSGVYLTSAGTALASSSLLGTMGRADQIDVDLYAVGSTSTSVLNYSVYVSSTPNYDCTATPTACDWYNVDQLTTADTTAHPAKDIINTITLSTTTSAIGNAVKRHIIVAQSVMAKYYKINFGSTVNPAYLWAEATTKESQNN